MVRLLFDALEQAFPYSFCWLCCSEIDEGCLAQEQFIQSAWKSSAGILVRFCFNRAVYAGSDGCLCSVQPWELDSSISPENRQVIERMLLEEQYPSLKQEM